MSKKPKFPLNVTRQVLKVVPSGEIAFELGPNGAHLRFDCDCSHAIPYCKSRCCWLPGIAVQEDEREGVEKAAKRARISLPVVRDADPDDLDRGPYEMERASTGACICLDPATHACRIYEDRPATCREFHCSKAPQRGWALELSRLDE